MIMKQKYFVVGAIVTYIVLLSLAYFIRKVNSMDISCHFDKPCIRFCCENSENCNKKYVMTNFNSSMVPRFLDSKGYEIEGFTTLLEKPKCPLNLNKFGENFEIVSVNILLISLCTEIYSTNSREVTWFTIIINTTMTTTVFKTWQLRGKFDGIYFYVNPAMSWENIFTSLVSFETWFFEKLQNYQTFFSLYRGNRNNYCNHLYSFFNPRTSVDNFKPNFDTVFSFAAYYWHFHAFYRSKLVQNYANYQRDHAVHWTRIIISIFKSIWNRHLANIQVKSRLLTKMCRYI